MSAASSLLSISISNITLLLNAFNYCAKNENTTCACINFFDGAQRLTNSNNNSYFKCTQCNGKYNSCSTLKNACGSCPNCNKMECWCRCAFSENTSISQQILIPCEKWCSNEVKNYYCPMQDDKQYCSVNSANNWMITVIIFVIVAAVVILAQQLGKYRKLKFCNLLEVCSNIFNFICQCPFLKSTHGMPSAPDVSNTQRENEEETRNSEEQNIANRISRYNNENTFFELLDSQNVNDDAPPSYEEATDTIICQLPPSYEAHTQEIQ